MAEPKIRPYISDFSLLAVKRYKSPVGPVS